jgi:hypothetical protein
MQSAQAPQDENNIGIVSEKQLASQTLSPRQSRLTERLARDYM